MKILKKLFSYKSDADSTPVEMNQQQKKCSLLHNDDPSVDGGRDHNSGDDVYKLLSLHTKRLKKHSN